MLHLSEEELNVLAESERNRSELPLTNWEALSAQLREEGIIRNGAAPQKSRSDWWLRAAAAVLLVSGGAFAGRATVQGKPEEGSQQTTALEPPVSTVASVSGDSAVSFKSEDDAWEVLNRAGADYQRASAFLAAKDQNAPADSTSVYQARLVALDAMTSASRKALYSAPHDPVINQYYLAAQGAREATLRQLSTSLPSGVKLVNW
ncbi:MAG: hypothetical protein H0U64_12675 [Gemmatimonadaceae bacterium]|nr:hypothetical protein [Gemmatimonadaceae bacterium]